jgi:hypothetical protein
MINHQSSVFLFDPDTGRPEAMVGGNLLTALRTAAASAIAIDRLARKEAHVLGIVGAGHQAGFQLRAAARVRRFERVIAWNLHPDMLPKLGAVAAELGLPFEAVDLPRMREADVIVTITSSPCRQPAGRSCRARHASQPAWAPTPSRQAGGRPGAGRRGLGLYRRGGAVDQHRRGAACGGRGDAGRLAPSCRLATS